MRLASRLSDFAWRWRQRLRGLFRPSNLEREIQDEMELHLEMEIRSRIEQGMGAAEARRSARLEFGSLESHRAASRDVRFGHHVEQVIGDFRLALRRLAGSPGFTAISVLTLSLGIGAAAAIWSLAKATLWPDLPYSEAEHILLIDTRWNDRDNGTASPAELVDYQERLTHVLSDVGGWTVSTLNLVTETGAQKIPAGFLSHGTMAALGLEPAMGRRFTRDEDRTRAPVALLSHALWVEEFASDPQVVGRSITLDSQSREVIGVMPAGAELPDHLLLGSPVDVYVPLGLQPESITNRGSHFLTVAARRRADVDPSLVAEEVARLGRQFETEFPDEYPSDMGLVVSARPLAKTLREPFVQPMVVLFLAVGFLLSMATANVAGLLFARGEERGRELAMRAALGAGRKRLIQQMAVENALVAMAGGTLGALTGGLLLRGLATWLAQAQARLIDPELDLALIGGAVALSAVCALTFSILPLTQLRRQLPADSLRGTRTSTSGVERRRFRRLLTIGQIAAALALLSVAGLLSRSFLRLLDIDPGFRTAGLVTTQISLPRNGYQEIEDVLAFWDRLVRDVESKQGVESATAAVYLVLGGPRGDMNFEIDGRPIPDDKVDPAADWQVVAPGYFEALEIPHIAGRGLRHQRNEGDHGEVVVNQTFVERHFPEVDSAAEVIGQRIHPGGEMTQPAIATIVGVIPDIRHASLDQRQRPQMLFSHAQFRFWSNGRPAPSMNLIVKSNLPPETTRETIASTLRKIDPTLPMSQLRSLDEVRHTSILLPRFLTSVLLTFAGVTLLLTVVGLYGVVSENVLQRLPELGVRRALGARAYDLARQVVGEGIRLFLFGIAFGALLSFFAARALSGLLFETSPAEPATHLAVVVVLCVAVLLACVLPAARAARVDPARLMRQD
ncbi:MAG: ADOP family duplicated permease [Thermoanaerobaculia bacterium]|nr:ADOP family duplicated permease [Thermoanaerobaculia bacterium]